MSSPSTPAVRDAVGVFDVSHLGKASVVGPGAADFVNATLANDLRRIGPGQAQYTLCCDDESGGVVDDLIAYVRADDDVLLVPNAANTAEVVRRLAAAAPEGVEVTDLHRGYGVLAVQGPLSDEVLDDLGLPAGHDYMSFVETDWRGRLSSSAAPGTPVSAGTSCCRAGTTPVPCGTRSSRRSPPAGVGPPASARATRCAPRWGTPCTGTSCRSTSRPVQARVGWAVGWKKDAFWGRDALLAEKQAGPRRVLWGLQAIDRGVPRADLDVVDDGGTVVGRTTSGTFSPTLKQGIALALLPPEAGVDDELSVDVRGRRLRCRVVKPPFVQVQTRQD